MGPYCTGIGSPDWWGLSAAKWGEEPEKRGESGTTDSDLGDDVRCEETNGVLACKIHFL